MRIPDFLRANDWQIREFFFLFLFTLISYDLVFLIDKFLIKLLVLPQLLGFGVLTFMFGFIILRILKVHCVNRTLNILLTVGLSLSFTMIFGLFINTVFPFMGILRPISFSSLFYAFNIAAFSLMIICYFRDRDFKSDQVFIKVDISPLQLLLILLPFFSVLGAYVMTFYTVNTLILVFLFLASFLLLQKMVQQKSFARFFLQTTFSSGSPESF